MKNITRVSLIMGIVVSCFLGACTWFNHKFGLSDDNPFEEFGEAVIKHHTGLNVDLTPGSAED